MGGKKERAIFRKFTINYREEVSGKKNRGLGARKKQRTMGLGCKCFSGYQVVTLSKGGSRLDYRPARSDITFWLWFCNLPIGCMRIC